MADLPGLLQLGEGADLLGQGHLGVDAVELEEVEPIHPQVPEAQLHALHEILGPAEQAPCVRPAAGHAALRADHQRRRVRRQGVADDLLGELGPVGVGGVDVLDAGVHGGVQDRRRPLGVEGRTPGVRSDDVGGAVADAGDRKVAAEDPGSVDGGRHRGASVDSADGGWGAAHDGPEGESGPSWAKSDRSKAIPSLGIVEKKVAADPRCGRRRVSERRLPWLRPGPIRGPGRSRWRAARWRRASTRTTAFPAGPDR